ncbi:MAG: reverse transcriptase family protein [Candidatus Thiodiazotropha taylori]|nr:reverse transcriptase family protein [Candidatus Thiodiazotropha taylori]MCW4285297.1 reverse transcriptase family protein [Candidatus Thiodiazotropha taylori]
MIVVLLLLSLKSTDVRGRSLLDLMHIHNLLAINTLSICTGATSSFISYGDRFESLIDHILVPSERLDTVLKCEILDDDVLNVSRHLPIVCSVSIPPANMVAINSFDFPSHVKWEKLDQDIKDSYKSNLESMLAQNTNTSGLDYQSRLDIKYSNIVNGIRRAADALPKTMFKPYLKPYWDSVLKNLHAGMREKRRNWLRNGRPRGLQHLSYKEYKAAKAIFRAHHRKCAEKYLLELNMDIDKAAEIDSAYFWKKINNRRKASHTSAGSEMNFNGNVCRDPLEIANGWGNYFSDLYSDTEREHYDVGFQSQVEEKVRTIKIESSTYCRDGDTDYISADEVRKAVKCLKKKKACGSDNICNEHLIYGGPVLYECLAQFYSDMYRNGYIPKPLKEGIIITLHKGGRKSKTDPNNYRAITLSSAILKLFERILLERAQCSITKPLNWLQGGFRPNIGCNMSSVMLRECILYAKENHSKLYVCYLDVQKAFDKVWHCGLFFKLYEMGIKSTLLKIIIELHTDMKSCVLYKGHKSRYFNILQGTRQGGVLSPFLYLCFADELLEELSKSTAGLKINDNIFGSPAVCDDLLLASLSKGGLDELMRICYAYSCRWRYEYAALKCCIVVYNESRFEYLKSSRTWYLGNNQVDESENYKHLGFIHNKYLSSKPSIKNATDKLKGTFFSLINSGLLYEDTLHPLTYKKIYNAVVLPKALYGCENWSGLSSNELLSLERAHRFCIKHMQSLGRRTRTDIALGLLAMFPIEIEIDLRKLILFGQLCRLSANIWVKTMFLNRLTSFELNPENQTGFIVEIDRLLHKYDLRHVLSAYLREGVFPAKFAWKRMMKAKVHELAKLNWYGRIADPEFDRFNMLHNSFSPHWLWLFSRENRKLLKPCFSVIQLISGVSSLPNVLQTCNHCQRNISNVTDHCIHECNYLNRHRSRFLREIFSLGADIYAYLCLQNSVTVTNLLLGVESSEFMRILGERSDDFKITCIFNLHRLWSAYKSYE